MGATSGNASRRVIRLEDLYERIESLTEGWRRLVTEAAAVCFQMSAHSSGVVMSVSGHHCGECSVQWNHNDDPRLVPSWADLDEAVEYGATGVAILLALECASMLVVERAVKGTGFDYWLAERYDPEALPFQHDARLEISGILNGSAGDIRGRVQQKESRLKKYPQNSPAYVIVVEFGQPASQVELMT